MDEIDHRLIYKMAKNLLLEKCCDTCRYNQPDSIELDEVWYCYYSRMKPGNSKCGYWEIRK